MQTVEEKKAYLAEWRKRNPEKLKRGRKAQDKVNADRRDKYANDEKYKEQQKLKTKEWQENNKRKAQRIRKYDLTLDEFNLLLDSQGGKCATGKVRGILCSNCNHALGKLKDDVSLLKRAIEYLEKSNG